MSKKLTHKQKLFVQFYQGNATEAAIKAGYSEKTAREIGRQNLTKLDILNAIQERSKQTIGDAIACREDLQRFWTARMRDESLEMKDRLKSSELLGKSLGVFLDRYIHQSEGPALNCEEMALMARQRLMEIRAQREAEEEAAAMDEEEVKIQ